MERENPFTAEKDSDFKLKVKSSTKPIVCETCGRKAKEYHRKLNAKLCIALVEVLKYYRHTEGVDTLDYFQLKELFKENPSLKIDFQKLQYWDLIEAKGKMVKGKFIKNNGWYRISENGIKFAQREVAVPITALVYNGIVQGHILSPALTIDKILSDVGINYDEIINPLNKINYES